MAVGGVGDDRLGAPVAQAVLDALVAVEHRHREQDRAALVGAEEDRRGLGQRGQQRRDAVAALHAERLQHVGEAVRERLELAEADPPLVALPVLQTIGGGRRRACRTRRARCCSAPAPPSCGPRTSPRSCRARTCESSFPLLSPAAGYPVDSRAVNERGLPPRTAELAADFVDSLGTRRVFPDTSVEQLGAALGGAAPRAGRADPLEVVEQLARDAEPGSGLGAAGATSASSSAAVPAALAADWLTSAWDQNAGWALLAPAARWPRRSPGAGSRSCSASRPVRRSASSPAARWRTSTASPPRATTCSRRRLGRRGGRPRRRAADPRGRGREAARARSTARCGSSGSGAAQSRSCRRRPGTRWSSTRSRARSRTRRADDRVRAGSATSTPARATALEAIADAARAAAALAARRRRVRAVGRGGPRSAHLSPGSSGPTRGRPTRTSGSTSPTTAASRSARTRTRTAPRWHQRRLPRRAGRGPATRSTGRRSIRAAAAPRRTPRACASTSASVVRQFDDRDPHRRAPVPASCRPPARAVACTRARSPRRSCASSPKRTSTWLSTTSFSDLAARLRGEPLGERAARSAQQRSTSSATPVAAERAQRRLDGERRARGARLGRPVDRVARSPRAVCER